MPGTDSKQVELSRLKNKMLEVEAQLKEEKKVTAKLRYTSERKSLQLMQMDEEITAETEQFRWKREENLYQRQSMEDTSKAKIRSLIEAQNELKLKMSSFDLITYENEMFNEQLKVISTEQHRNLETQLKERDSYSQRQFDARIEMDNLHRSTIKNFDDNYQKEAIEKMKIEASQANSENVRIYREFGIRENRTNELIRQQQLSYEQLMQIRIERDVMAVSVELQEKDILDLTSQNQQLSQELMKKAILVEKLREDIEHLQYAVIEKNRIMKHKEKLDDIILPVKKKVSLLTHEVNNLCHKLLYDGLEIVKKERAYQSTQISAKMSNLGSNLTKTASARYDIQQMNDTLSAIEELNNDEIHEPITTTSAESLFYSPDPPNREVGIDSPDPLNREVGIDGFISSPMDQSELFQNLGLDTNSITSSIHTNSTVTTLYEQMQQKQKEMDENNDHPENKRKALDSELIWQMDIDDQKEKESMEIGVTNHHDLNLFAVSIQRKQKKGLRDPAVRKKLNDIKKFMREQEIAANAAKVATAAEEAAAAKAALKETEATKPPAEEVTPQETSSKKPEEAPTEEIEDAVAQVCAAMNDKNDCDGEKDAVNSELIQTVPPLGAADVIEFVRSSSVTKLLSETAPIPKKKKGGRGRRSFSML